MSNYLLTIAERINAGTHHAFLLHGGTRDLQLGNNGSCSLVEHIIETFSALKDDGGNDDARLVVVYRFGVGWKFAVESDKQEFRELSGLDTETKSDDPFASMNSNSEELPIDIGTAIGLLDNCIRQNKRRVVLVIDRAEFVAPASSYDRMSPADKAVLSILQSMASDREIGDTGNLLLLVTDTLVDLAESLRLATSRFFAVEIAPPDYDERLSIARQVLPQLESVGVKVELSSDQFASATSMLTRFGLMDCFKDAREIGTLTKLQVKAVKQRVMSQEYDDVLETLDPLPNGFSDVAGLTPLKNFFRDLVDNMLSGNLSDVPTGALLTGAPGLGKTHFVRGLAGDTGLPTINFNIGKLLGSFVGQSERNLERALTAIRSAAPCIVCIDEIETAFPDRATQGAQGDSGVSSRILKRMLEELSNPALRGRVVWIGITNYPNKLDSALSRPGRFDVSVAFLPPTDSERVDLMSLYAAKYDVEYPTTNVISEVVKKTLGYTNAEIENVVRKARQKSMKSDAGNVGECWISASQTVRANTRGVSEMTIAALQSVNDADLLPAEYIDRWRKVTGQADEQGATTAKQTTSKPLF